MHYKPKAIDHIAITVDDIAKTVDWYCQRFECTIDYQDETWALLGFENIKLAFVLAKDHPPHIAFRAPEKELTAHLSKRRDGERSYYDKDCAGNVIEWLVTNKHEIE